MLGPAEWSALTLSLKVATLATMLGLPVAMLIAYCLARKNFPMKSVVEALIYLPLVMPPVVTGYLLLLTFAPVSPVGRFLSSIGISLAFNWLGAALASFIMARPLMVRTMRLAFETQDPALLDAAATLGAPPMRRFLTISLPLALPGLIAAGVLGFARALGEFGATVTFAANIPGVTQTLPLALYSAAQSPDGDTPALRLALLCLIPAFASLIASNWLSKRMTRTRGGKASGL